MKQQHKLQPKLRFPEFEGGWKEFSFKEIFNFSTGKNIKQKEAAPHFETPCVRYGELYYMYKEVISNIINYTNLDKSELKFSEGDEILLPSAGEDPMDIGSASALTLKNVAIGRTINILKPKNKNVYSSIFASYYINQKLRIKISGLAKGVSISNVYNTDLQTLFIKLPSLPEQQKIADYLSTIDIKINLLEEKKAQLALYKKAMMQKLFTQEIRFKPSDAGLREPQSTKDAEALEAYPEWEEKRLGEIISLKGGYAFKSDLFKENGIPIMRISNISNNNIYIDENNMVFYDDYKNSDSYKVYTGELLIALSGATTGKASIYNLKNFSYVNQRVGVFKSLNKCYYNFIVQYIFSSFFTKELKKMLVAGAQPNISTSEIESIILNMPNSIEEQQKIADFLSAIDESIEKVTEQINQTQSFKKAMLQQMFV